MIQIRRDVFRHNHLEIIYLSKTNQLTKRRIKILKRKETECIAYCYLRRAIRTFRYDNMLASHPITQPYRPVS